MGKSADRNTTIKQEFTSLEKLLIQTAEDASTCLRLLKKELSLYDSRHGKHFTNTSTSFMRTDMRNAKDTADDLKYVAHRINKAYILSHSEVEAARNMMDGTARAMDVLKVTARNYDKKHGLQPGGKTETLGMKGKIANAMGKQENEHEIKGHQLGMGKKVKYDHGEYEAGSSDTVEALVNSILRDNFNLSPLSHQITVAGKSLSSSPSFVDKAKEAIHDVKDKLRGDKNSPTHEEHHAAQPVNP
ncbi:hypothetical protein PHYBOEH_004278 [Phytophthora boehmeriae]|uniref:Uncharacterized protein n=1 Tax=Phytophthora boehmeriae TaxID=109152 RepID=A0A8T1WM09_9STRA|nr:hypothetical protein PHYBOEH_004278 [Phytophthora boehmeriae]